MRQDQGHAAHDGLIQPPVTRSSSTTRTLSAAGAPAANGTLVADNFLVGNGGARITASLLRDNGACEFRPTRVRPDVRVTEGCGGFSRRQCKCAEPP